MEGNEHKAHRKMLTNSFALNNIRKIEPIFKEKAKNICEFFDQKIASNDGKTGTFDCIDTFMKAILDISKPPVDPKAASFSFSLVQSTKWRGSITLNSTADWQL